MPENPFDVIKAEEFNHGLHQLASLMHFNVGLAGTLLSSSNVFLDGSRGSGKSMYLRFAFGTGQDHLRRTGHAGNRRTPTRP